MNKTTKMAAPPFMLATVAAAIVVCLGGVVYSYVDLQGGEGNGGYGAVAQNLGSLAQRIEVNAQKSVNGDSSSFADLNSLVVDFDKQFATLPAAEFSSESSQVKVNWLPVKKAAQALVETGPQVELVNGVANEFEQNSSQIHDGFSRVVKALQDENASAATLSAAQSSLWLTERVGKNLARIVAGADASAAQQLGEDMAELVAITESLTRGNSILGIDPAQDTAAMTALSSTFRLLTSVSTSVDQLVSATPALNKAAAARDTILDSAIPLNDSLSGLTVASAGSSGTASGLSLSILLAAPVVLAGLLLAVMLGGQRRQSGRIARDMAEMSESLSKIAEGDLTVRVSEQNAFTSDFAREINVSTQRQCELVKNIRGPFDVAVEGIHKIGSTARGQVEKAKELTNSVVGSTAAVTEMVRASEEIKASTAEAARTAGHNSEQVAQGYKLTQDMSKASTDVRESVQETSKTAKRQGELIQSVTAAAEYIQSLNTKISVVAINTRIEAEKAGEYGRPFLGIADSIADLLREAEEEGRKIISEVRVLQNLSAENMASMENTVGTVVTILEYVEKLDSSLEEINEGSVAIGSIVKSVDDAAAKTAVSALRMNSAMTDIRDKNQELGKFSETSQKGVNGLQVSMRDVADNLNQFKVDQNSVAQTPPRVAELEEVRPIKAAKKPTGSGAGGNLGMAEKQAV